MLQKCDLLQSVVSTTFTQDKLCFPFFWQKDTLSTSWSRIWKWCLLHFSNDERECSSQKIGFVLFARPSLPQFGRYINISSQPIVPNHTPCTVSLVFWQNQTIEKFTKGSAWSMYHKYIHFHSSRWPVCLRSFFTRRIVFIQICLFLNHYFSTEHCLRIRFYDPKTHFARKHLQIRLPPGSGQIYTAEKKKPVPRLMDTYLLITCYWVLALTAPHNQLLLSFPPSVHLSSIV